jgi:hypothetical protein
VKRLTEKEFNREILVGRRAIYEARLETMHPPRLIPTVLEIM